MEIYMASELKKKELVNTKLANNYGGWLYCNNCNQTIGYLCYVTYHSIRLEYHCNCGSEGALYIEKDAPIKTLSSESNLITVKNRLCCPEDQSPLITLLNQKLKKSSCKIVCNECRHEYSV